MKVFLDEINTELLSKVVALLKMGGSHPTHQKPEQNKR